MQNLVAVFVRAAALAGALLVAALPAAAEATKPDPARDFEFEFGRWNTVVRRLAKPLSGEQSWLEYRGTTVVRPLLDGRANIAELAVEGEAGRIAGVSLRLFEPDQQRWSLNFANVGNGLLTAPVVGSFRDGRGEFFGTETIAGREVRVRFVISEVTRDSARFEQAFSLDQGRTWEINWIALDTRIP